MNFTAANLIGGFIFGSIGFVAFVYGKKTGQFMTLFIGLALMAFPYFVTNDMAMYAVGVALTVALYFFRG